MAGVAPSRRFSPRTRNESFILQIPARYRFIEVLPLKTDSTILEIGSSNGQITTVLVVVPGSCTAWKWCPARPNSRPSGVARRALENVAITCGGDDCRSPL